MNPPATTEALPAPPAPAEPPTPLDATEPTVAQTSAGPKTYADYYRDYTRDPYQGDYQAVMRTFRTSDGPVPGAVLRSQVGSSDNSYPTLYVGLFEKPGVDVGEIRTCHALSKYPAILGRPTAWDNHIYAATGDVSQGQQVSTIDFPVDSFDTHRPRGEYDNVPATIARTREILESNPNDAFIGPFPDGDANIRQARTRKFMYVPHKYASLLINRILTPRDCYLELTHAILANGDEVSCRELVDWLALSITRSADGRPPNLQLRSLTAPVADHLLLNHRRDILLRHLPGLHDRPSASLAGDTQIARYVGDMVAEQRKARQEASDRARTANQPKTPSSYFGTSTLTSLLALCNVHTETALPPVWASLAASGKKDRLALEQAVLEKARSLRMAEQAPVITPDLAKKVTSLNWAGMNMDDLTEGIQPFAIVLPDYAGSDRGILAQQQAQEYDILTTAATSTSLEDVKAIKASKAVVPTDYLEARAHLTGCMILWCVLVGDDHPFVHALGKLIHGYTNREHFYRNRLLTLETSAPPPALLLRYTQLRMVNYWREGLAYQHLPADPPRFDEVLSKIAYSDNSWVPTLPQKYWGTVPKVSSIRGPGSTVSGLTLGTSTASATTVTRGGNTNVTGTANSADSPRRQPAPNNHINTLFAPFREAIGNTKIADAIARAGDPPTVEREGTTVPMCASFHLKGACWQGCARAKDHMPHTPEEDERLLQWVQTAYGS